MDFQLPELGEGVYEAELVSWLVKPGDAVKRGQNLMEVLTDKATMEVPAPFAGTITGLRAEPGQQIKVGHVVLTYTAGAETETSAGEPPAVGQQGNGAAKSASAAVGAPSAARHAFSPALIKAAPSVRQMARKL